MYKDTIKNYIYNTFLKEENTFENESLDFYLGFTKIEQGNPIANTKRGMFNDSDSLKILEKIKQVKQDLEKRNIKYIFVDYINDAITITCRKHQKEEVLMIMSKYGFKNKIK